MKVLYMKVEIAGTCYIRLKFRRRTSRQQKRKNTHYGANDRHYSDDKS